MKKAKDERNPYKELNNNRRAEIFLIPETKQDSSDQGYGTRRRTYEARATATFSTFSASEAGTTSATGTRTYLGTADSPALMG